MNKNFRFKGCLNCIYLTSNNRGVSYNTRHFCIIGRMRKNCKDKVLKEDKPWNITGTQY